MNRILVNLGKYINADMRLWMINIESIKICNIKRAFKIREYHQ